MFRKTRIGFIVNYEFLASIFAQNANSIFFFSLQHKIPFQPEALVTMLGDKTILPGKIATCKTEVMNGIKKVGLTHAIAPANAVEALAECNFPAEVIFKLIE